MPTMTKERRPGRPKFSGVKQQFHISHDAEQSLQTLADQLGKTSSTQVKREILEACRGIDAKHYYMALGELQKLANK